MEKLELWQQNEPLFHTKLNDEVKTVNELIDKYNQSKSEINGSSSVINYPDFQTYKHDFLEMWDNDGEGIVLSGYDNGFIGESGLYARQNPVKYGNKSFLPTNTVLRKIADYSELHEGGILYSEMTVCNDAITCYELKYQDSEILPNDTKVKKYKRLSRITADCKFANCADKVKWKAISINEIDIPKYSSSCSCSCSCSCQQYKVRYYFCADAVAGSNNWVRTSLLCGVNMKIPTTCNTMFMDYQQLMRFCGNELQVSYQWRTNNGGLWNVAHLPCLGN